MVFVRENFVIITKQLLNYIIKRLSRKISHNFTNRHFDKEGFTLFEAAHNYTLFLREYFFVTANPDLKQTTWKNQNIFIWKCRCVEGTHNPKLSLEEDIVSQQITSR